LEYWNIGTLEHWNDGFGGISETFNYDEPEKILEPMAK